MKKLILIGLLGIAIGGTSQAQTSFWKAADVASELSYSAFEFKAESAVLKTLLFNAGNSPINGIVVMMPTPEGKTIPFNVWRNTLIPAALQAKFPEVWSFTAVSLERKSMSAKIEFSPRGLYAMVYDGAATYFIDPVLGVSEQYKAYYKSDAPKAIENLDFACEVIADNDILDSENAEALRIAPFAIGSVKRTYRLALSCTGEYAEAVAGPAPTKAAVFAAMTTSMNRVNGIYERELAVTMEFIANNDTVIYTDPATDPFTANNNGGQLLSQNQSNTNSKVGAANYDIGHIFSTGAGGIATLGRVCSNGQKAMGVTGRPNPVGDPFDVDYVAHEMGHQFGADHSFNVCSGTENQTTAYEPGGGTTIMAYAGICGTVNNVQQNSDAYFHRISLNELNTYLTSRSPGNCPVETLGYTAPTLEVSTNSYNIPKMTPFEFDFPAVTANDPQSEILLGIEQYNRGNFQEDENLAGNFITGPTMRSFFPDTVVSRVFPRVHILRQGLLETKGERLSQVGRNYNFVYVAREIHTDGWGALEAPGTNTLVRVDSISGPFKILYPDYSDSIVRNSTTPIHWDVANTTAAPVNCATVDIYLSLDDGLSFPIVLAQNVPNNGVANVTIPDVATTTARVKVKGSDNIFFSFSRTRVVIGNHATTPPNSTSVKDLTKDGGINLYPNPTSGILNIDLQEKANEGILVMVNVIGQTVWTGGISASSSKNEIDTRKFAKGLYVLKFTDKSGQQFSSKVLVQ